jgi:hypothetical protein
MENQDNNNQENLPKENPSQPEIIQIVETRADKIEIVEKPFWRKFRTFFLDIAVVVIGVTLSTLFNDQLTSYNQQKDVKKFLLGLKADFTNDIKEMEADRMSYNMQKRVFIYISNIKKYDPAHRDSLKKIGTEFLLNTTRLVPNDSRYQGFKSAGKISTIDSDSLQNDILDLYQEDIPSLLNSSDGYIERKMKFINYMVDNRVRETDSTNNFYKLLATEKCYSYTHQLTGVEEIIYRYDICIDKMKKIMMEIDKQYK